jgi:surface antigen
MAFGDWVRSVEGRYIDEDGVYGSQCVDVVINYVKWRWPGQDRVKILGVGNAKDLWPRSSDQYFEKIANSPDPNHIPQPGDIMVWNATSSNPYGHIAVVLSASSSSIVLMEQDGFIDKDSNGNADGVTYRKTRAWTNNIIGWLRPKGGSNVIQEQELDAIRVIMSEVEGWNGHDIHSGKHDAQIKGWAGKTWPEFIRHAWRAQGTHRIHLTDRLAVVEKALKNEQNKPAKEVVKEVQIIVEKPVEVIKEVPVYTHDAETKSMIKAIFDYFTGQFKTFQKYNPFKKEQ